MHCRHFFCLSCCCLPKFVVHNSDTSQLCPWADITPPLGDHPRSYKPTAVLTFLQYFPNCVYTNRWSHPGHKLNLHACTCMLRLSHHPGPFFCPLPATPVTQKLETGSQRDRLRSGFTSLSSSLPSPCSLLACKLLFGGGYLILFVDPLIIYVSLCHC